MNRKIKRGCKMVALGAMDYVAVTTPEFGQARLALNGKPQLTAHNFQCSFTGTAGIFNPKCSMP